MIEIRIDTKQLDRMQIAVGRAGRVIAKEMSAALNATAKKTNSNINKQIRTELVANAADLKKVIKQGQRASATRLRTNVLLERTDRLELKYFKARQTRSGVSYRISKKGGVGRVPSAFIVNSLYGHVFKREGPKRKMKKGRYLGRVRQPIVKLYGPSPWGVFIKQKMTPAQEKMIREELTKQVERRIRLNILRAEGLVNK